jgi:hypothetical protein
VPFWGSSVRNQDLRTLKLNILKVGAEAMLNDRMEKVKANGINVRSIAEMGAPAEGIIDVAENEHVDLIVMGSRELKREKEYAAGKIKLGSVTRRVSERRARHHYKACRVVKKEPRIRNSVNTIHDVTQPPGINRVCYVMISQV